MVRLAIDTTTDCIGILAQKDDALISLTATTRYRHGESLMPWIGRIFEELSSVPRDLELVVCALGPGSFTGLRIGLSTAKGLAFGSNCPLVGIPSLDLYGRRFSFFPGAVLPLIDAKRKCFYTALYRDGGRQTDYLDLNKDDLVHLIQRNSPLLVTGPHAAMITSLFPNQTVPDHVKIIPSNQELATLLEMGSKNFDLYGPLPPGTGPIYLRKSEAEIHLGGHSLT